MRTGRCWPGLAIILCSAWAAVGQIDPKSRNLLEVGFDQPLVGHGPMGAYAYYYYNNPSFLNSNSVLRLAAAPVYLDSELGFRGVLTPYTDIGIGLFGGAWADNYYEVRQGQYSKEESFDGSGGGAAIGIYQLLNPGMQIPLSAVVRAGGRYSVYSRADTAANFDLPSDRATIFTRAGLRFGGKEPVLYPDLSMELSLWYEHQWRTGADPYGYNDSLQVNRTADLYWVYAGINYGWTNIGHRISFATTAGASPGADRFSAWRLGGVLPLVAEFPLVLPGYFYEELTARSFVHLYGAYQIPLDHQRRFHFRVEAASALLDYLPGHSQPSPWQSGVGCALAYVSLSRHLTLVARAGYGFNAIRDGREGGYSVGLLLQYDFSGRFHGIGWDRPQLQQNVAPGP